jgi:hypothetical protein
MNRILASLGLLLALALGLCAATFGDGVVITSAGQSNDILIAKQIFKQAGLDNLPSKPGLKADSLGRPETLVIVVGGSSKGLGSARDAVDTELARVNALLAAAAKAKVPVICMHLGRKTRRGPLSDPFIHAVAKSSATMIVIDGGNEDQLFTKVSREKEIPLIEAADYVETVDHIRRLFGLKKPDAK